jgi:hypothetical protein
MEQQAGNQLFASLFASLRQNFAKPSGSSEALGVIRDVDIDNESKNSILVNAICGKLSDEFQQHYERGTSKIKSLENELTNALWALQKEQLEFRVRRAEKALVILHTGGGFTNFSSPWNQSSLLREWHMSWNWTSSAERQ